MPRRDSLSVTSLAATDDAAGLAGDLPNRLGNEIMIETADLA